MTFLPVDVINEYAQLEGGELNKAKEVLAFEVTKLIHGEPAAVKAQEAARSLFGSGGNSENVPTAAVDRALFADGKALALDVFLAAKLIPSKSEGRRLIEQGGIAVDDIKLNSPQDEILESAFEKGYIMAKKGKKVHLKIELA